MNSDAMPSQIVGNTMDDLPVEVLEFILSFLPPYKDLEECMCVNKKWYSCVKSVMRKTSCDLVRAIADFKIQWSHITPVDMAPTISKRFAHAACVHGNSMYIFGGRTTNSTTFNDLWRFDLSRRQWIRPLAVGTYPSPKAHATLVRHRGSLILFGGWTYPSLSQVYQEWTFFCEIHFYDISLNRWIQKIPSNNPPAMAGHSATVHKDSMVVFGGIYKPNNPQGQIQCSNDVWVLDLQKMCWRKQCTTEVKPAPRYGQSLIVLDDNNLMILGGVKAPYYNFIYTDCWILSMTGAVWTWREITVKNKEWSAANIFCNPACKVGDKVVSLSRNGMKQIVTSAVRLTGRNQETAASISHRAELVAKKPLDRDDNINGKRGVLPRFKSPKSERSTEKNPSGSNDQNLLPSTSRDRENNVTVREDEENERLKSNGLSKAVPSLRLPTRKTKQPLKPLMKLIRDLNRDDKYKMAAFACNQPIPTAPIENGLIHQRQIAHLEAIPQPRAPENEMPATKKIKRNALAIHVLDISTVLNKSSLTSVSWLCPKQTEVTGAPEELVMYSLVRGRGELIMFGGVHNDVNLFTGNVSDAVRSQCLRYSNSLHFISPPRDII